MGWRPDPLYIDYTDTVSPCVHRLRTPQIDGPGLTYLGIAVPNKVRCTQRAFIVVSA